MIEIVTLLCIPIHFIHLLAQIDHRDHPGMLCTICSALEIISEYHRHLLDQLISLHPAIIQQQLLHDYFNIQPVQTSHQNNGLQHETFTINLRKRRQKLGFCELVYGTNPILISET